MSNFVEEYNNNINARAEENSEPKSIRADIPEYVYDIIAQSAEKWDTHKTNALIRLIRSGDFLQHLSEQDAQLIVRDKDDNETIIELD